MSYGLSFDPGMSSGICLFSWDTEKPFQQEALWQITDGAQGLSDWLDREGVKVYRDDDGKHHAEIGKVRPIRLDRIVSEKFTPRKHESFALTLDSVEPLRGEGVLIGRGLAPLIAWAQPSAQYFMGGVDLKDKKRRSREFLKQNGLYVTGKHVGQKDADDAISAELHAIALMRRMRHMPTLFELFPDDEGDE